MSESERKRAPEPGAQLGGGAREPRPSRNVRVTVTARCNQRCGFCTARLPVEDPRVAAGSAIRARIDAAVAAGTEELWLTGGEPTLRQELPAIVAYAKHQGAPRVWLETNAALLDGARVAALERAGLTGLRVHLPAWGEACDAITCDPGAFARTRAALELAAQAGLELEASAPLVRANRALVPRLPEALAASGLPVRVLYVGIPVSAPEALLPLDEAPALVEPSSSPLLPLDEAAAALVETARAGRAVGLRVQVDPAAPLPPCLLPEPGHVAHLFALTRGGAERADHVHLPACAGCAVRDRCPGFPRAALDREPALAARPLTPITDDRTRRRLSMISTVEEQIARELITRTTQRLPDGTTVDESLVRINFHCNQACRFCFVSTHLPMPEAAAIEAAIAEIAERRGVLTLSGGEPTLHPRLVEWVRRGKRLGAVRVELQTNAIRLADAALTGALAEAGLDSAFVSLHAHDAATSDAITEAPGTFDKTVRGLDELHRAGIRIRLNFVFCARNRGQFEGYVGFVAARWPGAAINISFIGASTDLVPRERSLIPRYADVLPDLERGAARAATLGVELCGWDGMCGVPLCLVPGDRAPFFRLAEVDAPDGEFVKPAPCRACALERRCFGLRRSYAELHGTAELRPVGFPEGSLS